MERRAHSPESFPRSRRLKRRRLIRPLFDRRRSDVHRVRAGRVHLLYRFVEPAAVGSATPFQVAFIPGRSARTKVGRNRLRRLLRESFRPEQLRLLTVLESRPEVLTFALLYRGPEREASVQIRADVPRVIRKLVERLHASP